VQQSILLDHLVVRPSSAPLERVRDDVQACRLGVGNGLVLGEITLGGFIRKKSPTIAPKSTLDFPRSRTRSHSFEARLVTAISFGACRPGAHHCLYGVADALGNCIR
jgi:hypothetical protein